MESLERTCSGGRQSDTSNGTTTASACLPQGSQTDSSPQPRSLATCVSSHSPVQLNSIEDLRTWLRQAFHANPTASQESNSGPTTREICGQQQGTAFAWFDREACCWKTCQASLLGMQHESSPTWPKWAMWDERAAYLLPTPEQITNANGFGLLPTPNATDNRNRGNVGNPSVKRRICIGKQVGLSMLFAKEPCPMCVEAMMGMPLGWSDASRPLAMPRFQSWLKQHGSY